MRYAPGKYAVGECARSGWKMLNKDMVRDGYKKNLLVRSDWYEPYPPQEQLARVEDPIALKQPAPDVSAPPGEGTPAPDVTTLPFD